MSEGLAIVPDVDDTLLPSEQRPARFQKLEVRAFALSVLSDPTYRSNLLTRARNGTLSPTVEVMLYAYAFGKPPERLELGAPGDFDADIAAMGDAELAKHAEAVAVRLRSGMRILPSPPAE